MYTNKDHGIPTMNRPPRAPLKYPKNTFYKSKLALNLMGLWCNPKIPCLPLYNPKIPSRSHDVPYDLHLLLP